MLSYFFQNYIFTIMNANMMYVGLREKHPHAHESSSIVYQSYEGQLQVKIVQKHKKLIVKILRARHIHSCVRVHVKVKVHGEKTTTQRIHRTQSISQTDTIQWNDTWKCGISSENHNYVTLSMWNRTKLTEPCDLIGCMNFDLLLPLPKKATVIADGDYYLLHKSIGACKHLKVTRPFDFCAPINTIHLLQERTITERHRVILPLNPTIQVGMKLCGTEAAVISVIHPHSPAERVGLKVGDVITCVNKHDVTHEDSTTVAELIRIHDYIKPLTLTVTRYHSDTFLSNITPWKLPNMDGLCCHDDCERCKLIKYTIYD